MFQTSAGETAGPGAKRTFTKSRHLLGAANSGSRRLSMALLTIFKDETKLLRMKLSSDPATKAGFHKFVVARTARIFTP